MTAFNMHHLAPEYIRRFEAYVPSKPDDELKKLYGCNRLYRLNNNENPLGPPPHAAEVIRRFPPDQAAIYPSGDAFHLRCKLSEYFGLDPDQILVGNGANEVIAFVIKAFCEQGDNIITADKTFAVYEWVAEFSGIEARLIPLRDFRFDAEAMLQRVDARTKVMFVCNPNNPTGACWNHDQLVNFLDRVQDRQIVVVDEAYAEFVEAADYPDSISLIRQYPNLVVFRTFSKMFALAGLRIGYLIGSREAVDIIRRACVVYSVNGLAQEAALATVGDTEHIERTRHMVREGKLMVIQALERIGLNFVSGEGNFMMIKLPMNDMLAYRRLMQQGIMVRTMTGFRFPNYIRLTIAESEPMEAFLQALSSILAAL